MILAAPHGGQVFNGYVAIPKGHPLHGKNYSDDSGLTVEQADSRQRENELPPIATFCFSGTGVVTLELAIDVHGGITYARDHAPMDEPGDDWWFGFDCLHSYSPKSDPDMAFARSQCELLAKQLAEWPGAVLEASV